MRKLTRMLSAGLACVALTLAAGCGGAGDEGASNKPVDPELLVSNPSEALGESVERFEDEVQSVEARFSFDMDIGGFAIGADGTFAYRAPESVHMTMEMSGGDGEYFDLGELGEFEVLILGDDIYMNTGFTGWTTMSLDDLGEDSDSLERLAESHAPFDYQGLVDEVGATVEYLGDTTVDGKTYTRLRVTTDIGSLLDSVTDSLGESGLDDSLFPVDLSAPMTMEVLMDPATMLPYTFEASADFGSAGQPASFTMAFKFFDYNGPVDIPEAPENAVPFEDAVGDAFGDLGYEE